MSKKLKVGIWGLGRAGHNMHMPELAKYPEEYIIYAGYDTSEERRKKSKETNPEMKIYDNQEDFLQDPEIDLISVATRSLDHVEHSIMALEAGKYVVCEKPVTGDYSEALRLKKVADKYPGKLFIRHNRRFEPAFCHIREIIESGKLGNVYSIKLCRHGYQWRPDWQTIIECGGGQLLNWGPHLIDHALQFLESPVKDVWTNLKLIAALGDAEDHIKLLIKGENNRLVDIEISGGVALSNPVYTVFGSHGSLISQDEKTIKMKYLDPKQDIPTDGASAGNPTLEDGFGAQVEPVWIEEEFEVAPSSKLDTGDMWKFIYDEIMHGKPYPITLDEALEVVRVTDIAKRAAIEVER